MSETGEEEKSSKNSRNRTRQKTEQYESIVTALNGIANQLLSNEKEQKDSDKEGAFRENLTIWLLIGTVILTGAADFIFYQTMSKAELASQIASWDAARALYSANSSAEDALLAERINSDAALTQSRQAQEDTRLQLAADVRVSGANVIDFAAGLTPTIKYRIKNEGATTAYSYGFWIRGAIAPFPPTKPLVFETHPPSSHELGRGEEETGIGRFEIPLNQKDLDAFKEKKRAVYVRGQIFFTDEFRRKHVSEIHLMFGGVLDPDPQGNMVDYDFPSVLKNKG